MEMTDWVIPAYCMVQSDIMFPSHDQHYLPITSLHVTITLVVMENRYSITVQLVKCLLSQLILCTAKTSQS